MKAISVETVGDEFVIKLNKNSIDEGFVIDLIGRLRREQLVKEVGFDSDIEALGEEIKKEWWQKNKARLLGNE